MAQALGPRLANPRVAVFLLDDVGPALGLDARQRELFGHDLGQLVHRQLDFKDVLPGCVTGPAAGLSFTRSPIGVPTSPGPWPTPPRFFVP